MIRSNSHSVSAQLLSSHFKSCLRVRFHGGPRNGQVVRIGTTNCTIGSGPEATLRLICRDIASLHCEVELKDGRAIVRRLDGSAYLNGAEFESSELSVGDILSIGPIDFEVMPEVGTMFEFEQVRARQESSALTELESELADAREREVGLTTKWEADKAQLQEQLSAALDKVTTLTAQADELATTEAEAFRILTELRTRVEELELAREADQAELATLRQELEGKEGQLQLALLHANSPADENAAAESYAEAEAESYAEAEAGPYAEAWLQSEADADAELETENNVEPDNDETIIEQPLTSSRESAREMLERLRSEASGSEFAPLEHEIAAAPEVDLSTESLIDEGDEDESATGYGQESGMTKVLESEEAAYDATEDFSNSSLPITEEEVEFSAPTDDAPIDTAAILAKFGHTMEMSDEDDYGSSTEMMPPSVPMPEPESSIHELDSDDDSIEDYMMQLMQRVGSPVEKAAAQPQPQPGRAESKAVEKKVATPVKTAQPEKVAPLNPAEFVPRAVAPEASSSLQALRAVANTSARSAIDVHQRRNYDQYSMVCWFIAIVAGVVCFAMAFLSEALLSLPTLIAAVCCGIAGMAAVKALAFTARAQQGRRKTDEQLAAIQQAQQAN